MGQQFSEISTKIQEFIHKQKIFFVGTATTDSRVNISPKGMDSFKIINANRVLWLNVTGSGNETAAHVEQSPRMTIMFAAFEGSPIILRLYGTAKAIHRNDPQWDELSQHFELLPGARQIFDVKIDLVQKSCGMAVPFFDFQGPRDQLKEWAAKKDQAEMEDYWATKNQTTIDGKPTLIMQKSVQS
ncbi:pyridoxamine 5'-phosphate oxidase family protein [Alteromonadaceae bacterium BrNp21-10]|nr:pyridoxamine 5'-phosphate oxidase family protein [Alteromonadaceae bacterium BrNp21-10]